MDALDLLKSDHDRVKNLFQQALDNHGSPQFTSLIRQIKNELEAHTRVEEQVFYPAFANYPEFKELLGRSYQEHRFISDLARHLSLAPDSDPISTSNEWNRRIRDLFESVSQHVLEEEKEFFPRVRKIMKRSEREQLGRHIQAFRQTAQAA